MSKNLLLTPGFAYLKNYEFYIVTIQDILLLHKGEFQGDLTPIILKDKHLMLSGFEKYHDNFGRGNYFSIRGVNIWHLSTRESYYYVSRRGYYHMTFFHEFQYFMKTYLDGSIRDFSEIGWYINNCYSSERRSYNLNLYNHPEINQSHEYTYQYIIGNEYF